MFYPQGAKKVKAQGIGVHKPEEIMKFGQDDLLALSQSLADKPFFFGDEPTTVSIYIYRKERERKVKRRGRKRGGGRGWGNKERGKKGIYLIFFFL